MAMREIRREDARIIFVFKCPGCGAEGELGIDSTEGYKPFGCPEGCGSMFVPYQPDGDRWYLKCVVEACKTVGEMLDEDPESGVYTSRDGLWWFGWAGKDYGPFGSHEEATRAMESVCDAWREGHPLADPS